MTDRERVLEELALALEWCSENDDPRGSVAVKIFAVRDALKLLKEWPEQKHGHWISLGDAHYTCSCCRTPRHMNFVPNYCSECGAKMDEEVTQDG